METRGSNHFKWIMHCIQRNKFNGWKQYCNQVFKCILKKISPDPIQSTKEIEYYYKNLMKFKELDHKNVVKYLQTDISEKDLQVDILLEYCPIGSLRSLIEKYGKFNEILTKIATRQILEALKFIHSKGVVHKNLKCSNILLDFDINIKLTDFGFFDELIKDNNGEIIFKGSPNWTSPEVF